MVAGTAASVVSAGGTLGTVVTWTLCPMVIKSAMAWPGAFYLPAGLGLLWVPMWFMYGATRPELSKDIHPTELEYILQHRQYHTRRPAEVPDGAGATDDVTHTPSRRSSKDLRNDTTVNTPAIVSHDERGVEARSVRTETCSADVALVPEHTNRRRTRGLRRIFTSIAFYSSLVESLCTQYGFYVLLTFMPQYMEYQLHCSLQLSGLLSVVPNVINFVGKLVAGFVGDAMIDRWDFATYTTRKIMSAIAMLVPAVALSLVPHTRNPALAAALFSLCMGANAFGIAGLDMVVCLQSRIRSIQGDHTNESFSRIRSA